MFRSLFLFALLGFGLLNVVAGQLRWGIARNSQRDGWNRIDCEGGPLPVQQILENIRPPCIVTTTLTVDSDEINLYFCEGSFNEQSCYKMTLSTEDAVSSVSLGGGSNVLCESPPKPFIHKGVPTLITITITSQECTVANPDGVKLPILAPNEANFRNCFASTDSGSQAIIEIQATPGSGTPEGGNDDGGSPSKSGSSSSGGSTSKSGSSSSESNEGGEGGNDDGGSPNKSGSSSSGGSTSKSGSSSSESNEGGVPAPAPAPPAPAPPAPAPRPDYVECASGPQLIAQVTPPFTLSFTIDSNSDVFTITFCPTSALSAKSCYSMELSSVGASVINQGSNAACEPVQAPFLKKDSPNAITVTINSKECVVRNTSGGSLLIADPDEGRFHFVYGSCSNGNRCRIHCVQQ